MEVLEGIDWEALGEFIEPMIGLAVALLFMGFVRLMKSSRRRQKPPSATSPPTTSPPTARTPAKVERLRAPSQKFVAGAAPIEPGDDAAKLSERYSQIPSR